MALANTRQQPNPLQPQQPARPTQPNPTQPNPLQPQQPTRPNPMQPNPMQPANLPLSKQSPTGGNQMIAAGVPINYQPPPQSPPPFPPLSPFDMFRQSGNLLQGLPPNANQNNWGGGWPQIPQAPNPPNLPNTPNSPGDWANLLQIFGTNPQSFGDKNTPLARFWENLLPPAQFLQNAYQWGQEYNQGNQRYWDQTNWQKQLDQFNAGLQGRQMNLAEWQQQEFARQFGLNFGQTQLRDQREWDAFNKEFGLKEKVDLGQLDVQRQMADAERMYKAGLLDNAQYANLTDRLRQQAEQRLGQQNLDLQREQARIDEMFKRGQLDNAQYANLTDRLNAQNQYRLGLGQNQNQAQDIANQLRLGLGQLDIGRQQNLIDQMWKQGQLDISKQQNQIDEMFKRGQLDNAQYANLTARLQQQAEERLGQYQNVTQRLQMQNQNTFQMGQLDIGKQQNLIDQMWKQGQLSNDQRRIALEQLEAQKRWGAGGLEERNIALGERTQEQLNQYRYAELAQQAALAREQMKAQERQAAMAAFGRAQAPTARWTRSWG